MDRRMRALSLMKDSPGVNLLNMLIRSLGETVPPSTVDEDNDIHVLLADCILQVNDLMNVLYLIQAILDMCTTESGFRSSIIEADRLRTLLDYLQQTTGFLDPHNILDDFFSE